MMLYRKQSQSLLLSLFIFMYFVSMGILYFAIVDFSTFPIEIKKVKGSNLYTWFWLFYDYFFQFLAWFFCCCLCRIVVGSFNEVFSMECSLVTWSCCCCCFWYWILPRVVKKNNSQSWKNKRGGINNIEEMLVKLLKIFMLDVEMFTVMTCQDKRYKYNRALVLIETWKDYTYFAYLPNYVAGF